MENVNVKCPNCGNTDWLVEVTGWTLARVTRDELRGGGHDAEQVENAPVHEARIETDYSETYVKCAACRVQFSLEDLDEAPLYAGEEN